jgi:hypothetical protein
VFLVPQAVRIRSTNVLERLFKEVKRRTRVVGVFPGGTSSKHLVGGDSAEERRGVGPEALCLVMPALETPEETPPQHLRR